jgi:DNA-binding response OmpR family regulator
MAVILVADDEPELREIITFGLSRDGHELRTAADGQEALDMVRRDRPDMCILDLRMPRLNGLEVLRSLRADEAYAKMPILILTARVSEQTVADALDQGADGYLTKPFSLAELRAHVRGHLRS